MLALPKKLDLLDYTARLFSKNSLEKTYLICCQHVLPSLYYLLKSAIQLGLPVENISVIGKCYSSSKMAFKMMVDKGIFVSNESFSYDSHVSFDEQFKSNVEIFLKQRLMQINSLNDKKVIFLDDGGELLSIVNKYLITNNNVLGVEQTSSGYNKLCNDKINFPIINVARSPAKLYFESPHIALSIQARLKTTVNLSKKKMLIIAKGYIGVALEKYLKKDAKIDFYDHELHGPTLQAIDLKKYDIIIGATGNKVFDLDTYRNLKKNVYLVSASSSDREFSAVNLRKQIQRNLDCHKTIYINNINLINSGFPINFYGSDYDNVPLPDIQLTFSLLLAAICQNIPQINGFTELDTDVQLLILKKYSKLRNAIL